MNELMFSVCVITYNQEKYISKTLESILSQEHNYKYEIVIGEDCSTDGTRKIIEEYANKYPSIIKPLYNNPKKGLINNYFKVIRHCSGKYIMECAGDDYWLPGKVAFQIDYMEKNPDFGMCYGKAMVWNESAQCFSKERFGEKTETFESLIKGNKIPALSVCFKNELIKQYIVEVTPEKQKWLMEDYPLWLWFSLNTKIKFLNIVNSVYRLLSVSASHDIDLHKQFKIAKNYNQIKNYFLNRYLNETYNLDDAEILFNLQFEKLIKQYTKKLKKEMKISYLEIKNKSFSIRIKYFLSRNLFLFSLLKCIIGIKKIFQ